MNFVKPHLKGFLKLDARYLIPFFTRRFTQQVCYCGVALIVLWHTVLQTALLARWLRCPLREWKIWGSNPTCDGIPLGGVIPVTSEMALQWLLCQVSVWVSAGTGQPGVSIL